MMSKTVYLFLLSVVFPISFLAQEVKISTAFSQDGNLYKSSNSSSEAIVQFKENEKCVVTSYFGKDIYKVEYKEWVGFVIVDDLIVTESMMDLYFEHQEKERIRTIKEREDRQKRIQEIQHRKIDSIAQIKEAQRLAELNRKRSDSIAKAKEAQRRAEVRRKNDSIAKAKETLRRAEVRRKNDSIVKAKETQRLAELRRKRNDSIAKAKETLRRAEVRRKNDSIAKAKETLRLAEVRRKNDSIAKAKETLRRAEVRRKNDSIAKAKEAQRLTQLRRKRNDSIAKAKEALRLAEVRRKNDSIAKVKETQRLVLSERDKFRNTCHYQINEYDDFEKKQIIKTEPYTLNKKLTVELYRQGHSTNIFFNFSDDLGCASYLPNNRSHVKVKLENNKTISFYHSWDIDCFGFFFKGRISKSQMINLKNSPIKSITLKGTKGYKEIINVDYKEFFIDKLKCIE